MKPGPNEAIELVVMRQADMAEAKVPSVECRCFECAEPCWVSINAEAQIAKRPGSRLICVYCMDSKLIKEKVEEVEIHAVEELYGR